MTFTDRPNELPHCPSTLTKYLGRMGSQDFTRIKKKYMQLTWTCARGRLSDIAPSDGYRHPQPASAVHSTRHCVGITSGSAPVMSAPPATDGDHLRLKYVLKSALRGLFFEAPAEAG